MAYGAKIYNSSGQVIIDDTEPSYHLVANFTMSGTSIGSGNFQYLYADLQDDSRPAFVELAVGDFLGSDFTRYVSTRSSLTFYSLKKASDLPNPSGYDVVFYNSSGQKTWIASASVAILNQFSVIPFNGSVTSDADHVALLSNLPYFAPAAPPNRVNVVCGVRRVSSTSYEWSGVGTGLNPFLPDVGPFPVSCLFAKSN